MSDLNTRANEYYKQYQERMTNDEDYKLSEIARFRILNNHITSLPFKDQVQQCDFVTKSIITNSTPEELLEWAKGQYDGFKNLTNVNATGICNCASIAFNLDDIEWKTKYNEIHKEIFDTLCN